MDQFVNHLSCTALLVGKKASVDGSTMIARNEDASGGINPKRFIVVQPADQPQRYVSTLNGFQLDLPQTPLQYTCTPVADQSHGTWGEAVSYTHLTLPTIHVECRSRWSPYH